MKSRPTTNTNVTEMATRHWFQVFRIRSTIVTHCGRDFETLIAIGLPITYTPQHGMDGNRTHLLSAV